MDEYDGWAIATSADGVPSYGPLPRACRVMVWVKPNAMPGPARIHNKWEAVIVLPPIGRRSSRNGIGAVPDVLVSPKANNGFAGQKPSAWTRWVLEAMSLAAGDTVDDLFPGSGAVSVVVDQFLRDLQDSASASEAAATSTARRGVAQQHQHTAQPITRHH